MTSSLLRLPIGPTLPQVIDAIRSHGSAVLRAPAGSGKTTRVPPALLDAGLAGRSNIIVLEPRRVAARAAARRIAYERHCNVGDEIGYAVRFDQKIGPDTRIQIVTDGVLLRMLQDDPFLEQAAIVVFDEFHERGLNADLALAMVRRVQQTVRPELKILVMSATIFGGPVAEFLGGCPVIAGEGRPFPVEIRYVKLEDPRPVEDRAASAVEQALEQAAGDVLVFLPGVGEIRRTAERLGVLAESRGLAVMPLFGDLSPEEQDRVLLPSERRKVVLATNVAETSITIEGIAAVVDTGLSRVLRYEPSVGVDRLVLSKISRASADQRAGRAGRTGPGLCLRLWTERDHAARQALDEPEVARADVTGAVLQLYQWGESDPDQFPWFEPPAVSAMARAKSLLDQLGAIDNGRLTDGGRSMAQLPVHPRVGRLILAGAEHGAVRHAALAAALISERDPFLRERAAGRSRPKPAVHRSLSDLLDRVLALEEFERTGRLHSMHGRISTSAAWHVLRVRDQLVRLHGDHRSRRGPSRGGAESDDGLLRAIFAAFPDRLARRREPGSRRAVMSGGHGIRLDPSSGVMEPDLFVCIELVADKTESIVRVASAVDRAWLDPHRLLTADDYQFDSALERVVATRRTMWSDLVVHEVSIPLPSGSQVAAILAGVAEKDPDRVLPRNDAAWDNFLARVRSLRVWMPELDLPPFDDQQMRDLIRDGCAGRRSFAELRAAPWIDFAKGRLTPAQLQALDRHAPERLAVPSGSRIALRYEAGRPPVLAVRIQELFGLNDTPRVAGGRVGVLLHLLAPSMRPQQVTDDLNSFWTNTYPKIRGELRRRYPKHAWPDDPRAAAPQRRPGRRS